MTTTTYHCRHHLYSFFLPTPPIAPPLTMALLPWPVLPLTAVVHHHSAAAAIVIVTTITTTMATTAQIFS
jgi:hypothetical protein